MGYVIPLGNITYLDRPTEDVLEDAKEECTEAVLVLGYNDEGSMFFYSSLADAGDVIWLLEKAKQALLEVE